MDVSPSLKQALTPGGHKAKEGRNESRTDRHTIALPAVQN